MPSCFGTSFRLLSLSLIVTLGATAPVVFAAGSERKQPERDFKNPPATFRPLQYISAFDPNTPPEEQLKRLQAQGLGGAVANVASNKYLEDESQWRVFKAGIAACARLGLRAWIYDEDGYPSAAAGGLVLRDNPALEAQELILDPAAEPGYRIRAAYEGTHASNNYARAQRYPNIIDPRAVDSFLGLTHDAYARHAGRYMGSTVEAFFTDEPSLIAFNSGTIPEQARKNVPIRDPLDPSVTRVPSVPWAADLPEKFRQRFGYDVLGRLPSLFGGTQPQDKQVRRDYWSLVADMVADRYFGRLRSWCAAHHVASSGHALAEENLAMHPAVNGNLLRNLAQMQIPGIDVLSSDPGSVFRGLGLTATLASSAALLNGTRRVMSETSDHSQKMNNRSASVDEMRATAAWQFALGVTDLVLMYGLDRPPAQYKAYADFAGRLGALLTPAHRLVPVALYYPISDLWTWYRPVAEPLRSATQPEPLQKAVAAFNETFAALLRAGYPVCLVDHRHLAEAKVEGRRIRIGSGVFEAVVVPGTEALPPPARKSLDTWRDSGGLVLQPAHESEWQAKLTERLPPAASPSPPGCLTARFARGKHMVTLLVNTTNQPWAGTLRIARTRGATIWHFDDGTITRLARQDSAAGVPIALRPLETVAVVSRQ
jgi:hypothetical protein